MLPYLGQQDRELPDPPADLVRREEAHAYPTNFNAMSPEWIDRLGKRGEQLTLCLARAYIPGLRSVRPRMTAAMTSLRLVKPYLKRGAGVNLSQIMTSDAARSGMPSRL